MTPTPEQEREIEEVMAKRWGGKVRPWNTTRYHRWLLMVKLKHVFGVHTYIPIERWDIERDTISYEGLLCWECERRAG